jgi:Cdc6-like AAA superfamily ATPase
MTLKQTYFGLIIGRRGTGKTTFTLNLIDKLVKDNPNLKVIICNNVPHPSYAHIQVITLKHLQYWQKGVKQIRINTLNDHEVYWALAKLTDTLIIFEDCSKYLANYFPDSLANLLFDSKQQGNNVLMMFHGWAFIAPKLCSAADNLTLFKTGENVKNHVTKIPLVEDVIAATARINKNASRFYNDFIQIT